MKFFWNRLAKRYDNNAKAEIPNYEKLVGRMKPYITKGSIVLEIATGTGIIANMIAPFCQQVDATDFSDEMIRYAKEKQHPENVVFSIQDVMVLPYPKAEYDVVIMAHALHVIPDPKIALKNIYCVLKENGVLIVPTYTRSNDSSEFLMRALMKVFGFRAWKKEQYLALFQDWQVIEQSTIDQETKTTFFVLKK